MNDCFSLWQVISTNSKPRVVPFLVLPSIRVKFRPVTHLPKEADANTVCKSSAITSMPEFSLVDPLQSSDCLNLNSK